jgi:hypothetical protein
VPVWPLAKLQLSRLAAVSWAGAMKEAPDVAPKSEALTLAATGRVNRTS